MATAIVCLNRDGNSSRQLRRPRAPIVADEDLVGLEVAVDEAGGVGRRQPTLQTGYLPL